MKVTSSIAAVVALVFASSAGAWRLNAYQLRNSEGPKFTAGGPGGSGSACHSVGDLNNKISSIEWYSDDPTHHTRCCFVPFNGLGCTGDLGQSWCRNIRVSDLGQIGMDNKISSFRTDCYKPTTKRMEEFQF
ncbi:conserved hypothetical protein [Trichophyton verrucosum HKI 0517]|uniref:Uncharacterized protein n=1 Tax=Trichophyton verrucosum (strain HKI 0517) TaxID=663202 RepID=D4CZH6_TRIVH|nr:uncharacterized protein TRV_00218 [Trichophyton verrucosum HKI 0517]EFE44967.1 conserved hypothetical protein [Trichophyton verrucosum HKI 0517]